VPSARENSLTRGSGVFSASGPRPKSPPLIVTLGNKSYEIGRPPSEQQTAFINASEPEQLYGGAKRGGKSISICIKLFLLAINFPGNRLGLFRQDLTDLRESTLVSWEKVVPKDFILRHHKTERYYLIRTMGEPSYVHYSGLGGTDDDSESAKGKEYGAFAIDEPSEVDPETYRMLRAQLCWTLPDGRRPPYMALLGSNPEPGWLEERFRSLIEPTEDNDDLKVTSNGQQIFIKSLPCDNPYLPPNWEKDQEYNAPTEWVKKYLRGSWKVSSGQVFKEFDERIHCIDMPPPSYLRNLLLVASIDHASTGITDMLIEGIDPDGNTVSLLEYREKDRLISAHAQAMDMLMKEAIVMCDKQQQVDIAHKDPGVLPSTYAFEYILIDPSTEAKTNQSAVGLYSNLDEYRRNGIPALPAYNALEVGINLVKEYLHPKALHVNPFTGERNSPSTFIVRDRCPGLVRDIIGLKRTITDRGAVRYVGVDHGLDNKRYILMSRPKPPDRTDADMLKLDSVSQQQVRMHERWGQKFDRGTGKHESNTWWGDKIS
jgi:hypothetical protein